MTAQITSTIMMIRPLGFRFNEQTAVNNYYQKAIEGLGAEEIQAKALNEFDTFVNKLNKNGIEVIVFDDSMQPSTPDSIFPNNWVSFHANADVVIYPMYAENRRRERRMDIFDALQERGYQINHIIDFSTSEQEDKFLEGTGSMILDRENNIAYAALSERTDLDLLFEFAERFDYQAVPFHAYQSFQGKRLPIYHTNVMMALGDKFVVVCLDSIDDVNERNDLIEKIEESGKEVIEISELQKEHFAGNMLQLQNNDGDKFMIMSSAAFDSLDQDQIDLILMHNKEIIHSLSLIHI